MHGDFASGVTGPTGDSLVRDLVGLRGKSIVDRFKVTGGTIVRDILEGRTREGIDKFASIGSSMIKLLDVESSVLAGLVVKRYGERALGLSGKDLLRHIDDGIAKTQHVPSAGDIAPIQASALGKMITLFQSYEIRQWNMQMKDVAGINSDTSGGLGERGLSGVQRTKNVIRFIVGTTAMNYLYNDILHIPSPFPTPLDDAKKTAKQTGGNAFNVAMSYAYGLLANQPLVGKGRYGQGFMGVVVGDINKIVPSVVGTPGAAKINSVKGMAPVGRLLGAPAT
jgi:hypothetical protein